MVEQMAMINAREIETEIGLKHPGKRLATAIELAQGTVAAIARAVGVAGGQKTSLQGWHDHRAEGMVHHPIAIGRR